MVSHIKSQKALENILWNDYLTQIYKVKSHFIKKEKKKKEDTIMPLTTIPTPTTTISTTVQQDNLAS